MKKMLLWVGVIAGLASGCGELSYKRGASTQDLATAKKSCGAAGEQAAVDKCLEDQGWSVTQLGDLDLFAVAGVTGDNRSTQAVAAPVTPVLRAPVDPGSAPAPQTSPGAAVAAAGPALAARPAVGAAGPSAAPTAPLQPPPPPASPLDIYVIKAWFKMGAGLEVLASNTDECVAQLGPAHRPNSKTQQATRGFVVCMHGKGWKALRG